MRALELVDIHYCKDFGVDYPCVINTKAVMRFPWSVECLEVDKVGAT
jgi:hypothetical protein